MQNMGIFRKAVFCYTNSGVSNGLDVHDFIFNILIY